MTERDNLVFLMDKSHKYARMKMSPGAEHALCSEMPHGHSVCGLRTDCVDTLSMCPIRSTELRKHAAPAKGQAHVESLGQDMAEAPSSANQCLGRIPCHRNLLGFRVCEVRAPVIFYRNKITFHTWSSG